MKTDWMAARVGLCVGALAFGGCTSTVNLPATELPKLSTQTVHRSADWPEVRTVEGDSERIMGEIQSIRVQGPIGAEPVHQPFAARINGPYLEVFGPTGPRGFPLAENLTVGVEYEDEKKKRNAAGGTLIGFGGPIFVTGIISMKVGLDILESHPLFGLVGFLPMFYGVIGIGGGIGMMIPGIVLVATDPKKDAGSNSAVLQPKLQFRPGGVDLTMQF